MTAERALESIHALPRFARGETMEPVKMLLDALREPQKALRFVHIAGTNGKGSISTMCAAMLKESGLRVGTFTSPYIHHFRERFQVNGQPVSPAAFARAAGEVLRVMRRLPCADELSGFDVITAIGFLLFAEEECDIVVLECGLGGRLDATNIIPPPLCAVIGNIGYDHTELLGDTIEKITTEKCGILKAGTGSVVCAPQDYPAAMPIIKAHAKALDLPLSTVEENALRLVECHFSSLRFSYREKAYQSSLSAAYQAKNAATALEVMFALRKQGYSLPDIAMEKGLLHAYIPARFELCSIAPDVILDGGHNVDGLRALRGAVEACGVSNGRLFCLLGMLHEKDPHHALEAFFASPAIRAKLTALITITPNTPRACPAEEMADILDALPYDLPKARAFCTVEEAVEHSFSLMAENDTLLCFGSLYSMGEIRRAVDAHFR